MSRRADAKGISRCTRDAIVHDISTVDGGSRDHGVKPQSVPLSVAQDLAVCGYRYIKTNDTWMSVGDDGCLEGRNDMFIKDRQSYRYSGSVSLICSVSNIIDFYLV
jgi:hypothetical protein